MKWPHSFNYSANQGPDDTLRESIRLLNLAKKSIRVTAGNINSSFYGNTEVQEALRRAVGRGVLVHILYDRSRSNGQASTSGVTKIGGVTVEEARTPSQRHFTVIDGKHVRLEKHHEPNSGLTPAIVCRHAEPLAQDLEKKFRVLAPH